MVELINDEDCWNHYSQQRILFNKLWLANMLGYLCGPCGVKIPKDNYYITRPIYNLDGMSKGATVEYLKAGDRTTPLGYFWCEYFSGSHYSVDFEYIEGSYRPILVVEGKKESEYKFTSWTRLPIDKFSFHIPDDVKLICGSIVQFINIEYIEDKIIEIHLRRNPDFINNEYSKLEVVWSSSFDKKYHDKNISTFIPAVENVVDCNDKFVDRRIGFYGKGNV